MLPFSLPGLVVGTARLGSVLPGIFRSARERERGFSVLDDAVSLGCTAFDLAASYQAGGTERLVGEWIASRRNRDRLFLISKGGHPVPVVQPHRITPSALAADLDASLRRVGTTHFDLYLLHRDDAQASLDDVLEAVSRFRRQEKVRAWGLSNWTHARIDALAALARASGVEAAAASSPHFSLLEWVSPPWPGCVSIAGAENAAAREYYAREQLPVLAWSPLGSGFFSASPAGASRSASRAYASPENAARRERAERLGRRYGCTGAQIALAYVYSQPFPVSAVVAANAREKMARNVEASRLTLTADETRWLEDGGGVLPA
ncbi:MAG: aldo/keto reductase [Polyangiaceae bacterium]|nr:aldo/keto reductase [Polyangiaceae bacterium]